MKDTGKGQDISLGTSGFFSALRARALRAPIFLCSLSRKTGRFTPSFTAEGNFTAHLLRNFVKNHSLEKISAKVVQHTKNGKTRLRNRNRQNICKKRVEGDSKFRFSRNQIWKSIGRKGRFLARQFNLEILHA